MSELLTRHLQLHHFPESQNQLPAEHGRAAAATSGAMWGSLEANIHCFRELYMGRVSMERWSWVA